MSSVLVRVRKCTSNSAHVVDAFAHTDVQFVDDAAHLVRLLALGRVAQQLHLNLQECEGLRNGVVQFAREQCALLADRCLALQRGRT